ncbi:MAG: hypothetical protein R3C26_19805 [Calditrichia bacterium]
MGGFAAVLQRQRSFDQPNAARARIDVPDVRLHRTNRVQNPLFWVCLRYACVNAATLMGSS